MSAASAATLIEVWTVAPSVGALSDTVGAVVSLATMTLTVVAVLVLPAASRATAVSAWAALVAVRVSHATEYGALVSSAPRLAPSSLNCTPLTAVSSEALAVTLTVPPTVAPSAGAVTDTVGLVVSTGGGPPIGVSRSRTTSSGVRARA